ncbi:MAG: DUF5302 family protein [Actinomycetes bacterium]
MANDKELDPAKAAFLAALERKKSAATGVKNSGTSSEKSGPKSSGPSTPKRMERRRSGSA